jgi:hypothetical protein
MAITADAFRNIFTQAAAVILFAPDILRIMGASAEWFAMALCSPAVHSAEVSSIILLFTSSMNLQGEPATQPWP